MIETIRERAEAKLNLTLEVVRRRADGYHEIATVFQTIDLVDEIAMGRAQTLSLEIDDAALDGPDNLVVRAAHALASRAGAEPAARIEVRKRIPVAAGLGGGSADAAAALRGLARLWAYRGALDDLARGLGADVPFLLRGGTALARGTGDALNRIQTPSLWMVGVTPHYRVPHKTARAYGLLATGAHTSGRQTEEIARELAHGRTDALKDAPNAFETIADELFPGLPAFRAALLRAGARWTRLSGAGPTLFTGFDDAAEAQTIASRLTAVIPEARIFLARTTEGFVTAE